MRIVHVAALTTVALPAAALPAIAGSLGSVENLSWVVVSYLIAATIAAPVFGRLGDVFGLRNLLLVALGLAALLGYGAARG